MSSSPPEPHARRLRVARRAETLFERIERLPEESIPEPSAERERALARWALAFAAGDRAALERRLAWDAIAPELAARALGAASGAEESGEVEPPEWLAAVESFDVVGHDLRASGSGDPQLEGVPFAELWRPWSAAARRRLRSVSPWLADRDRSPLEPLVELLGREIGGLSERAAYVQFARMRAGRPLGHGAYAAFVDEQLAAGLLPLYEEFPLLLRATATLARQFVDSSRELSARLDRDREALAARFDLGVDSLRAIEPLGADRHADGRRALRLDFADGRAVAYKPRSVAAEARWAELGSELRAAGVDDIPPAARVLERAGYGWVEWIAPSAPEDEAALARWFRRGGATLALADLLGIEDLHAENVVATADGPVLIDLELALRPARTTGDLERGAPFATGLVARRGERARGARAARWAGFERTEPVRAPARGWKGLGGDDLQPVAVASGGPELHNLPRTGGREIAASERRAELVDGYRSTARALLARRVELERPGGGFDRWRGVRTRLLFRTSQDLAALLDRLATPDALADAAVAGLVHEASLRPFAASTERPALWPLVAVERAALERLDLPRFEAIADSTALPNELGAPVVGVLVASGLERARRRFALWSEADLAAQAAELERELAEAREVVAYAARAGESPRDRFARVARAIALEVAERRLGLAAAAVVSDDADLARAVRRASLYDGVAGEALLLAACAARAGGEELERAARTAERELLSSIARLAERREAPLGAMQGVGSWLWTLVWLETLRGGDDVPSGERARLAARLLASLDADRLATDRRFDVEGGLAGLLLGLLAVAERWPALGALPVAVRAGERLLACAEVVEGGLAWSGEGGRTLAGFAHGACGIARALGALARATGDLRFADAAAAALRFEASRFDPASRNWPVVLADGPSGERRRRTMTAWCHGAPGIALARLLLAPGQDSGTRAQADAELETALATTAEAGIAGDDHLCCGAAGRASILHLARALGRGVNRSESAAGIAGALLDRAATTGTLSLPQARDPLLAADWGMMRGRAGVAWMSAELAGVPLPSVLALELPSERNGARSE